MRLVTDDQDIVAQGVGLPAVLAEFLDQREDVALILLAQHLAKGGAVMRLVSLRVGAIAVGIGAGNLVVQFVAVGDNDE